MKQYKPVDYGFEVNKLITNGGVRLYQPVTIEWSAPRQWRLNSDAPINEDEYNAGFLYAITRHTARSVLKAQIKYVGLTTNAAVRFRDHHITRGELGKGVSIHLSVGRPDFHQYRSAISNEKQALEELEHILIWSVPDASNLWNSKKQTTVPGQGKNRSRAWHIVNSGHGFEGQMPEQIVFPWVLIKNRTVRRRTTAVQSNSQNT